MLNLGPYGTLDTVGNVVALSFMVIGPLVILAGMARARS
jgi:hypothetical protein